MEIFLGALAVFSLRICDVSVGTIKLLYIVRGRRTIASMLAFVESGIWLGAASLVFSNLENPWNMLAFSAGFALGTVSGMTIERWIASGHVLIRIVTRTEGNVLLEALRERKFGLTTVHAEGKEGKVMVLLVVAHRRRSREALMLVQQTDPAAFVTIDPVSPAVGGYLVPSAIPSSFRK